MKALTALVVPLDKVEDNQAVRRVSSLSRDSMLRRLLLVGDIATTMAALVVALVTPGSRVILGEDLPWALVAVPIFVVVFKLYGLYDRDVKRISHSTVDDLPWLMHALLIGTLLLWIYSKLSPMHQLDLRTGIVFAAVLLVGDCAVRALARRTAARLLGAEPALLIGGGPMAGVLVRKLRDHPEYRLGVVGSLVVGKAPDVADDAVNLFGTEGVRVLGAIADLEAVVAERGIGRIVVSPRDVNEQDLAEVLRRCRTLQIKVTVLPALSDALGAAVEVDDVEGVTVLGVNPPWLSRSSRALKRAMDITLSGALLLMALPAMALIALLVKLDSPGSVFFGQTRVGKGGRTFRLFKFRTMCVDAEQRRDALLAQSTDSNWLKLDHDPRITRSGRWLRRTSLDELPQLWNVVRGEMSLVGPRPLIEAEDRLVKGWARGRLDLTPGITGYWQVLGRTRIPFEEMVKLDYLYVTNWSLWEDIRLMLRTLPAVIGGRGAN
jgi:exopolysaccharide biosynthesis polyprenyl glycosylphosphotransferase